ncbi:hypothetical protein [Paenibacillus pini]|nr:hypothetical protein [Paenibacillus pini]
MLIKLKEHDLDADQLGWLCIAPIIDAIRGKNMKIKLDQYSRLNQGRRHC